MPTIYDNIDKKFSQGLLQHLHSAKRVDYCAGYFNLRGWKIICDDIDNLSGLDVLENGQRVTRFCRLLVGMTKKPLDIIIDSFNPAGMQMDNERAAMLKRQLAEEFKKQLELGAPTDEDERTLKKLLKQLKSGKVVVKLFLGYQLHAKLYLAYTTDSITNRLALMGSSNFTFSGLQQQGELNIDVLEQDAAEKLSNWFDKRWNDRWCFDITKELIAAIENSWAREVDLSPYHVYMKMAFHLSQEARAGISEFKLPPAFQRDLLDFQQKAVLIAAHHLSKRNGVMVGDVVGLGKTITACAIAKIMEEDLMYNTLILCPKNLVEMWREYVERYGLHANVISHSMVLQQLPDLRRYRLVIIDESHNFRNSENKTYKVVKSYIEDNDSKVILLSATPYNKSYADLANQLKLFIPEDLDLGIGPERYIEELGGVIQFHTKHENLPVRSIGAFEKSPCADDWRELMRLYLVRRTRSFIKANYAHTDSKTGRKYLLFPEGTRSYFPERLPKKILFSMTSQDAIDQYAKLYDDEVVSIIDSLSLPRYTMHDYLKPYQQIALTSTEKQMIENLSRAGKRTKGFCRTNLYKRLESCGYSFLLSVSRLILRNYIVEYAVTNRLPVPIGGSAVSMNMGTSTFFDLDEYSDIDENADITDGKFFGFSQSQYRRQAELLYEEIYNSQYSRFQWLRADLFNYNLLQMDLNTDNVALLSIINKVPMWESNKDRKLAALEKMLKKTHPDDKVLIFTQYADTARYLLDELEARNLSRIGLAVGGCDNLVNLVKRFSPISNNASVSANDELRIMIATDVLSEGQNLQDAHIVVNFDLPWALIRLIQRAGRVDRLGQTSEAIYCYSFLPEDGIEKIILLRDKLKKRIKSNAEVVGSDEVFFDGDPINIADLYSEKSGILDEDDDSEVDLASYAYQIWKNAIDARPELERTIASLPNVVFSTKNNTSTHDEDSVIVYTRTSDDHDILSWVSNDGSLITQSQYTILRAAECDFRCPTQPRIMGHHKLVKQAVELVASEEQSATGTLGRKTGVRYRAYIKLNRFVEENEGTIFYSEDHKRALDDIYKYPLRERARDVLSRQLKIGASDMEFANTIKSLREDNKLCIIDEAEVDYRPTQIICSLGMRKVV